MNGTSLQPAPEVSDTASLDERHTAARIVRDLNSLYDQVSLLHLARKEPVRSLIATAGMLLHEELRSGATENTPIDATSRELLMVALKELGFELES